MKTANSFSLSHPLGKIKYKFTSDLYIRYQISQIEISASHRQNEYEQLFVPISYISDIISSPDNLHLILTFSSISSQALNSALVCVFCWDCCCILTMCIFICKSGRTSLIEHWDYNLLTMALAPGITSSLSQ